MPLRQQIVTIFIAAAIFILILELIRRRKLLEEYAWLWLMTGFIIIVLTIWHDALTKITHLIGAVAPQSTVFFFAVIFLILICLQFSIKVSNLTNQVKNLAQELTILKSEIQSKKQA